MQTLIENVENWAEERGLFIEGVSTPEKQFLKTVEEVGELASALATKDTLGVVDAIGDITVTLIILSKLAGVDIEYCLQQAFRVIKNRKGQIINGTFVKS
jgi:NTP pyrophosphatase (non-canonical NTP hydrolase)